MGANVSPSEGSPRGPAPLHLGAGDQLCATAREVVPSPKGQVVIELPLPGKPTLRLSKRGAGLLGRWLLDWARPRAKIELWGIEGIAQKCKVSRATVYNWKAREGFPQPIKVVGGNGDVWEAAAVRAWMKQERPVMGRKRKARSA